MCCRQTGYCDGSCDEAKEYCENENDLKESLKECPYTKECIWETLNTKTDRCLTCGLITNY